MSLFSKKVDNIQSRYNGLNRNFKLKAEIDMGAFNYVRYHLIQSNIDMFLFNANCLDRNAIRPLYSSLRTLFSNIQKLMAPDVFKIYSEVFSKLLTKINEWESDKRLVTKFPTDILNELNTLHEQLMTTMQIMNLGDRAYSPQTTDQRLREAIVGN